MTLPADTGRICPLRIIHPNTSFSYQLLNVPVTSLVPQGPPHRIRITFPLKCLPQNLGYQPVVVTPQSAFKIHAHQKEAESRVDKLASVFSFRHNDLVCQA
jgi:hypothetical protein